MKKIIIFLFIVAVGIGIFFGVKSFMNSKETLTPVENPAEIVYKLVSIERMKNLPGDITTSSDNEWLVIKVFGQNYDSVKRLYNMYYFSFEDENGTIIENSPNSLTDAILYGEVAPNGTISGTIVFNVPSGLIGKLIITDEKYNTTQELTVNKR